MTSASDRARADEARWREAERAVIAGDAAALDRLLQEDPAFFREGQPPPYVPRGPAPSYAQGDARTIIAREQHFEDWSAFASHAEARANADSPIARFEAAAEAVIAGDEPALQHLLRANPDLVRARSARRHRSALLHYVGANGIEGFRQKTPKNAVRIASLLLDAGADVNGMAEMYGGYSPLGLIATSLHPHRAGVQDALIRLFLDRGARMDAGLVNACLENGRGGAAETLAARGAPLDLEGAAGVGRLVLVASCFDENGTLRPPATSQQLLDGFAWACEFGHTAIVEFLLRHAVAVDARVRHHGQTGLHWAAVTGQLATIDVLLAHGAPLDAEDATWSNTPLGWALHGWEEAESDQDRNRYYDVVSRLVSAGAAVRPEWMVSERVRADDRMRVALTSPARS